MINGISGIVADAVMRHEALEPERCRLATTRGLALQRPGVASGELPYGPGFAKALPGQIGVIDAWRRLRAFDAQVAELVGGEPFHAYLPNTRARYFAALRSHKLCTGHSFLEAGLAAYRTREETNALYPRDASGLRQRIRYGRRLTQRAHFAPGERCAYAATGAAFPGFPRRVLLKDALEGLPGPTDVEDLLVFDGLAAHGLVRLESVEHAVRRLFAKLRAEGVRRLHFKFAPAQRGTAECARLERVLHAEAAGIELAPLSEDTLLEGVAARSPRARFYVNASSFALYAAHFGRPVYSYAPFLCELEAAHASTIAALPACWHRCVRFLS